MIESVVTGSERVHVTRSGSVLPDCHVSLLPLRSGTFATTSEAVAVAAVAVVTQAAGIVVTARAVAPSSNSIETRGSQTPVRS